MMFGTLISNFRIAGNTTMYSGGPYRSPAWSTNENAVLFEVPEGMTFTGIRVVTDTAQPGDGPITFFIRNNKNDQTVTVVVPAGAAANTFTDNGLNSDVFAAGDKYTIRSTNGSASVSANIVECVPLYV